MTLYAYEKAFGLQTPMPLDDDTMFVHKMSNSQIYKHRKIGMQLGQNKTPLSDLQSQNLAKEFDAND